MGGRRPTRRLPPSWRDEPADDCPVISRGTIPSVIVRFDVTIQLLIDSIVRQVTVLIAQLATSGGVRAPLAHIANQVFIELAHELDTQGISRKASADMFGMALRAYIRKVRRLDEGKTDRGRTLWQAVLDFVRDAPMVPRSRILERFRCDGELEVSAILHDLLDSGLVFASGSGAQGVYRAASDHELMQLSKIYAGQGIDDLVWVTVFRSGPIAESELATLLGRPLPELREVIRRLAFTDRVERLPSGRLRALEFIVPLGSTVGWEAAVFDHVQAVVQTICQRLGNECEARDWVGGSTFTFDVWHGHPLEAKVKGQLAELRRQLGELRLEVSDFNKQRGIEKQYEQVTTYVGQCGVARTLGEEEIGKESDNEP